MPRTSPCLRLLSSCTIFFYSFSLFALPGAFADQPVTVSEDQAQQYNPNSSITIDPNTGFPVQAQGHYTPAEVNPLLGQSIFMTPLECAQKFGVNFCQCGTTEEGYQYCYYSRPSTGYYTTMASCEAVWGAGQCICPEGETCRLNDAQNEAAPLECNGKIYIFTGQKMECRKAGVMSAGNNCCESKGKEDQSCSFENISKEIGMGQIASLAFSLGTSLASLAGYDAKKILADKLGTIVVEEWVKNGTTAGLTHEMTMLFGSDNAQYVLDLADAAIAQGAENATENTALGSAASEVAGAIADLISFAGWVYFAYQLYNMYTEMQKCTSGELMLGCKIAKGVCHHAGSRCKSQAFGTCLQRMEVYCCYNSKLARIVNEQGLPQLGKSFGTGENANCKGFTLDEFVTLNLGDIDLTEYQDDLMRELSPNAQKKYMESLDTLQNTLNMSKGN